MEWGQLRSLNAHVNKQPMKPYRFCNSESKGTYPASPKEQETKDCFLLLQEIRKDPRNTRKFVVYVRSLMSSTQFEYEYAEKVGKLVEYIRPWDIVPWR